MKARRLSGSTTDDPGQLLGGRYELGRLLGCGGMSNVYRARDRATGLDVAVKLFRPGLEFADAQRRRDREVAVLSTLEHDGLVAVLDADTSDGTAAYLVIELVDGPTLSRHLRDGPLPESEVVALGATLCSAVAYMHERGVVHRDLKPANILLADVSAPDLGPKLTDFGIARVIDNTAMTGEGLTVGTANYLSPEQVSAQTVGPPSDVYSLGLVLIEALTARTVYPGLGVEAALARLHRQPVLPDWIGAEVAGLLTRMTDRRPELRPTADDVAAELAVFADSALGSDIFAISVPGRGTATPTHRRDRSGARLRFGLLAGAAAAVVVAMTSGLVFAAGDSSDTNSPVALAPAPTRSTPSEPAAPPSSTPAGRSTPSPHPTSTARDLSELHDGVAADVSVLRPPAHKPSAKASTSHPPTATPVDVAAVRARARAIRAAQLRAAQARDRRVAARHRREAARRRAVHPPPRRPKT